MSSCSLVPYSKNVHLCIGFARYEANTAWWAALKRVGIEDFRFHDLRHIRASWLAQAGVPISVLQEMGGWESIEMVQRYAHISAGHLSEHASKIDTILNRNVTNIAQEENVIYMNRR
ncbi:hypothetical protein AGJ34_19040 [Cronobacter dublinensis subsp. dublinensis]|nr:hypothetical protein [Cronobacter dublinensis subsp. dublinensis]EGT5670914.1 hypothetical protein [Cronobacter dublinensis subsp. dublinensis]EGT5675071.1 hypothetical protein [Cronobacter dublinensis subsp. dublinensis]EGT5679198.1 hypothetical protein [Cronobacter dublinensis subsp. dublinensis]EGT5687112.1 hypothetical protein [Cronobacter dublinensis subsp. dublinensis]